LTLGHHLVAPANAAQHMPSGSALLRCYPTEALRRFHAPAADPDLVLAETTLAWVQQSDSDMVHLAQVYQFGPNSVRDARTARGILDLLEGHGWLIRVEGGQEIDGAHRREVWRVRR